ncbi:hypothetical protein [Pseudoalteromonas sp. NZS37]|uniref:hypothetical protein n=1 Tax=Pseudoalteromonas sp. NZS37 TaxID=2792071 RepID=UPI0018CF5451|nr:hypothetical protein [Pseudoalteromonas sp. NZS37]MBG9993327.1 hypothetical protein [Pseudoalteromonas sp. NZS37]
MSQNELVLKTIFGELSFGVTAKEGDLSNGKIVSVNLEPMIPEGMEVEDSIVVLLRVNSSTDIKNLNFTCTWNNTIEEGGACTGQFLDAWEWEKDNHLLLIGTEDEEILGSRLGTKYLSQSPVTMGSKGFEIHIKTFPKDRELTLHYVVSSNGLPEKEDCSCWFAVDVAHKRVLEACE